MRKQGIQSVRQTAAIEQQNNLEELKIVAGYVQELEPLILSATELIKVCLTSLKGRSPRSLEFIESGRVQQKLAEFHGADLGTISWMDTAFSSAEALHEEIQFCVDGELTQNEGLLLQEMEANHSFLIDLINGPLKQIEFTRMIREWLKRSDRNERQPTPPPRDSETNAERMG